MFCLEKIMTSMTPRWFRIIFLCLTLALLMIVIPVSAQDDMDAAKSLANYMPAETIMYGYLRTDDTLIRDIDSVIGQINQKVTNSPLGAMTGGIPVTLSGLLDTLALRYTNADFQSVVRPWLGDSAALGLLPPVDGEFDELVIALEISDRNAAGMFAQNTMNVQPAGSIGGFALYTKPGEDGILAINDDVLLLATSADLIDPASPRLSGVEAFNISVDSLPEDSYDVVAFVKIQAFITSGSTFESDLANLYGVTNLQSFPPTSIGVKLTNNNRTLLLDIAGLPRRFESSQNPLTGILTSIDPSFLANAPQDAAFVFHIADLPALWNTYFSLLQYLDPTIDDSIAQINSAAPALLGMPFNEMISWMTGDIVLYMSYDPPAPGAPSLLTSPFFPGQAVDVNIDFGLIIEATDPAAAQNVVNNLTRSLNRLVRSQSVTITQEQIGGTTATVISLSNPMLAQPFELVLAANERVLVFATRKGATAALTGSGGFDNSVVYLESSGMLLDTPVMLVYYSPDIITLFGDASVGLSPAIGDVFNNIISELGAEPAPTPSLEEQRQNLVFEQQAVRDIAALFSGFMGEAAVNVDANIAYIRYALTLAK
jgi:hypothetical protein